MSRILIMTDSTCDLPADWIRRHDIRIVPTYVHFGQESLADDGVQLRRTEFYERLATSSTQPTTAAPPVGQTIEVMSQALADADHVVGITAPADLSAIFNIFRLAAEELDPARVTLIDSRMVSMGLGWQVVQAAEMAAAGHTPAEIEGAVRAMQPRTDVWAALDTLEYLRRSGRVGWATAFVGDLFRIKPIIRLHDAVVSSVARVRTSHSAFRALVDLAHKAAPLERLAVLHTNNIERARDLVDALTDIHPQDEVPIVDVTPVIGVHVGPRGLGLGLVRKQVQE
jgi:DegV family protein with EDD domain